MKEEKEKRIDTKKEKEIKTGDVTMHETEEPADVFPEKTGDNLIFLDDPKLRKEYLDCMRYLLTQITDFGFEQEQLTGGRTGTQHYQSYKISFKNKREYSGKDGAQETGVDRGECIYLHK